MGTPIENGHAESISVKGCLRNLQTRCLALQVRGFSSIENFCLQHQTFKIQKIIWFHQYAAPCKLRLVYLFSSVLRCEGLVFPQKSGS